MDDGRLLDRVLAAIEDAILPLTREGVAAGNKVFGAALLRKDDGAVVIAGTNNETGESAVARRGAHSEAVPRDAGAAADTRTWCSSRRTSPAHVHVGDHLGGVRQFRLLLQPRGQPRRLRHPARPAHPQGGVRPRTAAATGAHNAFWRAGGVAELVAALPAAERAPFEARIAAIRDRYARLSDGYQQGKAGRNPLA